jgi:hypothetical protein
MGVSLPSDLIVDVMRGADPAKLQQATARLQSLESPSQESRAFANVLDRVDVPQTAPASAPSRESASGPYVEFEQMVLRNMFEAMLPAETSGAFGSGPSAGIWRSLAADQLAALHASAGGIGIAAELAAHGGIEGSVMEREWPYFSTDEIKAYTG